MVTCYALLFLVYRIYISSYIINCHRHIIDIQQNLVYFLLILIKTTLESFIDILSYQIYPIITHRVLTDDSQGFQDDAVPMPKTQEKINQKKAPP